MPRKDWRWRVRYRDARGRTREQTFARKFDAERFLETNGADLVRGEWIDPRQRRVVFEHWANEWWVTTIKLRPSTRRGYRIMLDGHVLPWFGQRPQAAIDYLDVERFIAAKLQEGLGRKKVRDLVSIVSCVMRLVVLSGAAKTIPPPVTNSRFAERCVRQRSSVMQCRFRSSPRTYKEEMNAGARPHGEHEHGHLKSCPATEVPLWLRGADTSGAPDRSIVWNKLEPAVDILQRPV